MGRWLLAGGISGILVGAAFTVPVLIAWLETDTWSGVATATSTVATLMIIGGLTAIAAGARRWRGLIMPAPARAAVAANMLFLAFFALEISDGLIRRDGAIHAISAALFLPAATLLYGLVSGRAWAWWIARGVSALATLWFFGFLFVIPFADLHGEHGPTPWWGRLYMMAVTVVLTAILAGGFLSLGRATSRSFFGLGTAPPTNDGPEAVAG